MLWKPRPLGGTLVIVVCFLLLVFLYFSKVHTSPAMGTSSDMESLESALALPHVHVRDKDEVLKKVRIMAEEGPEALLFLTDFDMTLTRYWANGRRGFTTYEVVEKSSLMSAQYRQQADELKKRFHPIEVSISMSPEEKVKHMIEWWIASHQLLVDNKLKESVLKEMTAQANIKFRDGCEELFATLNSVKVPLLIFSAGLEDTLLEAIRQYSSLHPNMYIVSNKLTFDQSGAASGFSEPLVHSYNKGKSPEQLATVVPYIKSRTNVVLMGDSQGDPRMPDSLPHIKHVLKIGFLNHDVEELLPTYTALYDVVLTGDSDMSLVNSVVSAIIHSH